MIGLLKAFALTGGEWVIYILILSSVIGVAIMIEKWVLFSRERKELQEVKKLFGQSIAEEKLEKNLEELGRLSGLSAQVLCAGLSKISKGVDAVEAAMISLTNQEKQRLESHMIIIGTLGSNAIYVGLFGTVLGVIKAFHDLAQESGAGPEVVMQGLSEALIATAVGLLVSIPCVVAYNVFQKQLKDLLSETESITALLTADLKSRCTK